MASSEKTQNLQLNKWLGNDSPKREDFVEDNIKIDHALTPQADPTKNPSSNGPFKLVDWVSYFANRIRAIVGKSNWWETPTRSLEEINSEIMTHKAQSMPHKTADGGYKWNARVNADKSVTFLFEGVE